MCCWLSSLTLQLLPFAGDWAAACRVLRAISRAPSWFLFPPIKPPAWTKMQPLIPLSSDRASSRTPRHSSSRDSLGQEDRRASWLTDGHNVVSSSLPVDTLLLENTLRRACLHNQKNSHYKTSSGLMNIVNQIPIKEQNKTKYNYTIDRQLISN